jgi:glycosyltransferase involved in cell wall biosynthesis
MGKFELTGKVIYLVSTEYWGTMFVSKHHYALQLAAKGNRVYFIEPPSLQYKKVQVKPYKEESNVFIVSYKPVMRGQRFLPKAIYSLLIRWQISILKRAIGQEPDIVWCFDNFKFNNLTWFKAQKTIFHAVDFVTTDAIPPEASTADIRLCSSEGIKKMVERSGKPAFFVNHGLNAMFCEKSRKHLDELKELPGKPERIRVGYIGNLLMQPLDRDTMRKIISEHPDVEFCFWGQIEKNRGGLAVANEPGVQDFIEFLRSRENVRLFGPVPFFELYEKMLEMDMFWICWRLRTYKIWNENTNPHKILEYLSTGKPVVSHYMYTYRDNKLIDMLLSPDSNEAYPGLFSSVLQRVRQGEPAEMQRQRIEFALDNSYSKQIERIEQLLGTVS